MPESIRDDRKGRRKENEGILVLKYRGAGGEQHLRSSFNRRQPRKGLRERGPREDWEGGRQGYPTGVPTRYPFLLLSGTSISFVGSPVPVFAGELPPGTQAPASTTSPKGQDLRGLQPRGRPATGSALGPESKTRARATPAASPTRSCLLAPQLPRACPAAT